MVSSKVVDWLLEPSQPGLRYRTLVELLGRRPSDPAVRAARDNVPREGWAARLLGERVEGAGWPRDRSQYVPKYVSTNWQMLLLSELGATRSNPAVAAACEYWMAGFPLKGGGVGGNSNGKGHHCVVGNMTRALIRFGYSDDLRVRRSLEWLVRTADPKGGWSCWGSGRNLDSWEGLSAFAAYPRSGWTQAMERTVARAVEFYLSRELHLQGDRYPPWYRFHSPVHYYYDVLVGLDLVTALGYGDEPRLEFALDLLRKKRRKDGRWNLDAVHPDVDGSMAEWYIAHPKDRPIPLAIEAPGRPSKLVTLTALKVLGRVEANS